MTLMICIIELTNLATNHPSVVKQMEALTETETKKYLLLRLFFYKSMEHCLSVMKGSEVDVVKKLPKPSIKLDLFWN